MIRGAVNARREAVLRLRVRGPSRLEGNVDVVVDTGFTASLTLPATTIVSLSLVRQTVGRGALADGSIRRFGFYPAEVEWDGIWRPMLVSAVGDRVLAGMSLLAGHALRVAVVPGGAVEITPLPSRPNQAKEGPHCGQFAVRATRWSAGRTIQT